MDVFLHRPIPPQPTHGRFPAPTAGGLAADEGPSENAITAAATSAGQLHPNCAVLYIYQLHIAAVSNQVGPDLVQDCRKGEPFEGGDGATVVTLR